MNARALLCSDTSVIGDLTVIPSSSVSSSFIIWYDFALHDSLEKLFPYPVPPIGSFILL